MVMVVEDHPAMRSSLRRWLAALFPTHVVVEAATGEEALVLARRHAPQLVLMDAGLPGMDGIEATRRLKAAMPSVAVVVLTIHDTPEHRARSLAAGASAFVPKAEVHTLLRSELTRLLAEAKDE